jgi:preprotein translocase SecE subunit
VARNRKRAKARRPQRPPRPPGSRPGTAGAGVPTRADADPILNGHGTDDELDVASSELDEREAELVGDDPGAEIADETPQPLDSGDAEIAKEQIMLGAAHADELQDADTDADEDGDDVDVDAGAEDVDGADEYDADEDAADDEDADDEPFTPRSAQELIAPSAPLPQRRRRRSPTAGEDDADLADEVAETRREVASSGHRQNPVLRLVNFIQGSWRELQRVQWPDRRQVMQATGVVIGFVVVAGVFLGVSDWIAGKIVNWIIG